MKTSRLLFCLLHVEQIKQMIERSNLVITVIGPQWLGKHSDGSRRIDDPADFVRLEIEYAISLRAICPIFGNLEAKAEQLGREGFSVIAEDSPITIHQRSISL